MIYPSSTVNPQYYVHGRGPNRIKGNPITIDSSFGGGSIANVLAEGTGGCTGIADHGRAASQGWMCSPRDWRNVEMSIGITSWTGDSGITMHCRGGEHKGNHACQGFAYRATIFRGGILRMAKESWHLKYDYWDDSSWQGGVPVGLKFCCYDNGQYVILEIWGDQGLQNSWRMIKREIDKGFGTGGGACNYVDGAPGLWGGPFATLESSGDLIIPTYFSIREINPFGSWRGGTPHNPSVRAGET